MKPRTTTIASRNRITIPVDVLNASGLVAGELVVVRADGSGRVVLERWHGVLEEFAGAMTGAYRQNELSTLRNEWR